MKKLISLLLAMIMVFSLAATAFADETGTEVPEVPEEPEETTIRTVDVNYAKTNNQENVKEGSITINKLSEKTRYSIYKMLHLEGYDTTSGAYSYVIVNEWLDFFTAEVQKGHIVIENSYVTWTGSEDASVLEDFSVRAIRYAEKNNIQPVKTSHNETMELTGQMVPSDDGVSGTFSGLSMGWYLVDSTMGALCGLTTTNPAAYVNAKNGTPVVKKNVQEDSTTQWEHNNTADIGQIVNFRTTIEVHAGAEKYVLHDKMSKGLTFQEITGIYHIVPGTTDEVGTLVDKKYYNPTCATVEEETIHYLGDGCSFEIEFTEEFCDHLNANDKIIVYYTAMLNRNAIVAEDGNPNESWLNYGDDNTTNTDKTYTHTFGFDLIKTDAQNVKLKGAKFLIYNAETGGETVDVVPLVRDGVAVANTYRRARENEDGVEIETGDGQIRIVGFDNGTYYLEETVAPAGYNKLTARQKFIIADKNLDITYKDGVFSSGSGVHVVNKTGSMLPETGAMGTTMFIFFGTFAVLATGVLLVTKKRMTMIEE